MLRARRARQGRTNCRASRGKLGVVNTTQSPSSLFRLLTDAERTASMQHTLRAGWDGAHDLWIFGYGSLVWRPEFEHQEARGATLRGYHRSLCLWSRVNRGTPEQPGLVFGLDRGGSCKGMVYRLAASAVPQVFPQLWQREMPSGAYLPRWLPCHTHQGPVRALAFVMDRRNVGYAGRLPEDQVLHIVRRGVGKYGHCVEYVAETARALRQHGIIDRRLEALVRQLEHSPPEHHLQP